ncbi:unnamed protein product [Ascophyllum nodosum]
MLGSRGRKTPRARRVWILVAALIVAVACGQSGDSEGQGGPPNHGQGGPPDHAGGPPNHEGQGGPPDHAGGPPNHEGQGGPPDHAGGPPNHEGGPPNHEGGPPNHEQHGGDHEGMGGGSMMNEGPGNERGPPPACTSEQTQSGLEASSAYVQCTEVNYETFMTLVHADVEVLQGASTCFAEKVQEIEKTAKPDENGEVVIEVDEVFAECIEEVEDADDTKATAETAEFLNKLIGPDSKICSCLPSFVEKTPECDIWMRYRHFAMHLQDLCQAVDTAVENASMPGIVELDSTNQTENQDKAGGTIPSGEEGNSRGSNGVMNEHPFGPCPPGQDPHPEDPTKCQTSENQGTYFGERESSGGRGPPPEGQGSIFGALMSVVGVVTLAGIVGVGGLWAWGKFHGGARQPGVRYMAANVDNDIGTELGPFGREYA